MDKNRWCPECKIYQNELIAKSAIEYLTGEKFIKIRPEWLKTEKNTLLELDGFNEKLGIAFESNGAQHYEFNKFFFKTQEDFIKRQHYDQIKINVCKEKKINLIIIPYFIKQNEICSYIRNELIKINFICKQKSESFDINQIFCDQSKTQELINLIESKNGKLISGKFINQSSEITLKCEKSHEWTTKIKYILHGAWCHICGLEVSNDKKENISKGMKSYFSTEKGKKTKKESFIKRTETMTKQKEEIRLNLIDKNCKKCGEKKQINEFNKKSDTKDGYQPYCRLCINTIKRQRNANKE